jgi:hypothetical protein
LLKITLWVIIIGIWFFVWYGPWQEKLNPYLWLRLGIGLAFFIAPGMCIYGLLAGRSNPSFDHFTFGFVISHLLFALLGMLGRFTHLSFETVKLLMALLGLIPILLYVPRLFSKEVWFQVLAVRPEGVMATLMLILVSIFACLVVIQRIPTSDDLTYLAYLTNWQNTSHLDFNDVIFGEPSLVHPRFWLMSAPFAQALLSNLSNIPGILILSGYYEPFLVILSVLCWYGLARILGFSPRAASASAILQLAFLLLLSEYLHPGAPFYTQLSADKATAAFIMAPVFVQSLVMFLKQPVQGNIVPVFLTGLSLTFMHPVILAYSVFIGGVLILFNLRKGSLVKLIFPFVILIAIILPQAALRFANAQTQGEIPYASESVFAQRGIENLIQRWGSTQFYGFNPAILDMTPPYERNLRIPEPILHRGWLILPILSALFALKRFKHDFAAQFLLACSLICLLAAIPFTGWIIGYFLSAWMLERALWLYPFGLSTVFLFAILWNKIKSRSSTKVSSNIPLTAVTFMAIAIFSLYMRENKLPDLEKFTNKSQRYKDLALAGQMLDDQISTEARVIGSPILNDLIPGISSKSKLITFRISDPSNMLYFAPAERDERIADSETIFSKSASAAEKLSLLRKYDVHFLVLQRDDIRLFEDLIENYPDETEATEIGGVIIVEID